MGDKVRFTSGTVERFTCPAGKGQAFQWDATVPGLALRITRGGAKAYVFQSRLFGNTLRLTIGSPTAWRIPDAQKKARELQRLIDEGKDPRDVKAALVADDAERREQQKRQALTVGDVWPRYMAEGKPKKRASWKPRYLLDLTRAASPGGEPKKRGRGLTKPGHLAGLMSKPLASIDQDAIRDWYAREAKTAPVQAARAVAMFSGFLGWCATKKDLRGLVDRDAARASQLNDILPGNSRRADSVEVSQLPAWFAGCDKLGNPVAAAYLKGMILTGARREELAGLKWTDVDIRWKRLTLADKVDQTRTIPLTPYLAHVLSGLQRRKLRNGRPNPYVFASNTSESGRIAEPRFPHTEVLADAGIPHVSIHGLRRTFSLLGEAAGAPAGAIAQVMGHKPSATAEGYRPRSIDALRPHLERIEQFILDSAGVAFTAPPRIVKVA